MTTTSSTLKASDVKTVNVSNSERGYIMHIHTVDNNTITRMIEAKEAREFFQRFTTREAQIEYIVDLFNKEYTQPQQRRVQSSKQTPDEELYNALRSLKAITGSLSVEQQARLEQLEQKLFPVL
jgi:hypothetical protein